MRQHAVRAAEPRKRLQLLAAAADVAVRSEMSLLRKEAKLGKEAGERIRRAEEKRKRRELELAEALRREVPPLPLAANTPRRCVPVHVGR